ncbi:MAG: hypothetical protein OXH68_21970 [Gammaproteobacteria bacterium]|nr:hypothetical protein [Gammaproteobacteria bacterium]
MLRLHDPATGLDLPYFDEAVAMYRQAQARAAAEEEARQAAEQRVAELEDQLRRSKDA